MKAAAEVRGRKAAKETHADSDSPNKIGFLLALSVAVALAGAVTYLHLTKSPYTSSNTPNQVLAKTNPDFNTAKTLQNSGEYTQAFAYYQKALANAQDVAQQGQIQFDLAFMKELSGEHIAAIGMYKQIAADQSYSRVLRAYAVQEIGTIYLTYPDQQAIVNETFKDTPYSLFLSSSDNDVALAYRKLYQYAASMYPLGMSESKIAQWYSNHLRNELSSATTTSEGKSDLASIQDALKASDADIQRMRQDAIEANDIQGVYMREGLVHQDLAAMGVESPDVADATFKQALNSAAVASTKVNFLNIYYAAFLADQFGSSRLSDITQLLSVYSATNTANIHPAIPPLLAAARSATSMTSTKKTLMQLGQLDPAFKSYLISLGWHASDF